MKWLQGMLAEVEKITILQDSDTEVDSSHQVLGELPDHLKRLFSYCMELHSRTRDLKKEADESDSKKAAGEIRVHVRRLDRRLHIASELLWEEIKFEFREQINPELMLDLCKGWKVCAKPMKAEHPLFKIFGTGE